MGSASHDLFIGDIMAEEIKKSIEWDKVYKCNWVKLFQKYEIDWKEYYNPLRLLTEHDTDNEIPGIIGCCSNRSAGKTTAFQISSLILFKEFGCQVIYLYRYQYELNAVGSIFEDTLAQYPQFGTEVTAKPIAKGLFYAMFLDDILMGYAISLNNPDSLKKYAPLFANTYFIVMEEFQTENGTYLANEIGKLQSILLSVSRGGGKQSRFMRLILLSNNVTIMNPYFIFLGVYRNYQKGTKFLHGKGYVFQFEFNEAASKAMDNNRLLKAFRNSDYLSTMSRDDYLIDASTFIQKPKGRSKYIFTIVYSGEHYGVWEYYEEGFIYVSSKYDKTFKTIVAFHAADHTQNTVMLNHYDYLWSNIKEAYEKGFLRFSDMKAKSVILEILAIDMYK